ncbi:MAG TPA: hypothetical protein VFC31_14215 [Candidatus Limnocylindria bacterium]|nr:hypothetical protein [Candidatus Limnocylindria bacterium]
MPVLRYVYAFVPASTAATIDAARLDGIDGTAVRAIVEGPFAAATSGSRPAPTRASR